MPDAHVIVHDDLGHNPTGARAWCCYLRGRGESRADRVSRGDRVPDQRACIRAATADEHETPGRLPNRPGADAGTRGQDLQPEYMRTRVASSADQVQPVHDSRGTPRVVDRDDEPDRAGWVDCSQAVTEARAERAVAEANGTPQQKRAGGEQPGGRDDHDSALAPIPGAHRFVPRMLDQRTRHAGPRCWPRAVAYDTVPARSTEDSLDPCH